MLLCLLAAGAGAFETMNRIRNEGTLRMGALASSDAGDLRGSAERLAASLAVEPALQLFARPNAMLEALAAGTIDVVVNPVDVQRPLPDGLTFTHAVDHADLAILGDTGAPYVRFESDAWYRMVARRTGGELRAFRMLSAGVSALSRVDEGAIVLAPRDARPSGRLLATRQPRAWVYRADDAVLAFKLNRFIQSDALRRDAAGQEEIPPIELIRARLEGRDFTPWDDLARSQGRFHGIDWRLLLAIMYKESRFDPDAVSRSGARGLMQLKPIAASEVGMTHYEDPADNVLAGARYFAWSLERFAATADPAERVWLALAAYNGGLTHIRAAQEHAARHGRDPQRWFGHVEHSLEALDSTDPALDPATVRRYVSEIRRKLAIYMRLTEGAPQRQTGSTAVVFAREGASETPAAVAIGSP